MGDGDGEQVMGDRDWVVEAGVALTPTPTPPGTPHPSSPIPHPPADAEAIIVGGGPAGSALATLLAERGHRVLVLDKASFPRHKACSEYVNAEGARILDRLGVLGEVEAAGAHRMEGMRVHAPGGASFLADFAGAEAGRAARGLSRRRLDHILLRRAAEAGAAIRQRAHVREVLTERGRVVGVVATIGGVRETLRAPLVVGADGHHSVVARALGLDTAPPWPRRTGLVAHYRAVRGLERWGELHVAAHGYAGLAPLEDGLTNVALVAPDTAVAARTLPLEAFFNESLAQFPALAAKLAGAERVGSIRGVGTMAQGARRAAGDGFLLVGDAASFLDPFTGEGIYEALRAAEIVAPIASAALRSGDTSARALAPYRAARRRAFAAKRAVCWIVQLFISTPPLLDYATPRLAARTDLALTLAAVLGDFRPARQALSPRFLARVLRP